MLEDKTVLIVEDGDEYLQNLSRFVEGPRWLQAHDGRLALGIMRAQPVHLVYLDMRFDRIELGALLGDHAAAARDHNGDPHKAWKHLQNNQGLYVLEALRQAGLGAIPVILAYDFSREEKRFLNLRRVHPSLHWVPDAVTPGEIGALIARLCG